ncbi:Leucine carboxyl methyltransferase 1 [Lasiodiplodia theobromae]|uniref:Leucine carboxyl methyltransferase 1 n=1 Tax=Lasiodiplodia theobromae TaxID=45133 RepID=A0A5N5DPL8_9PEZI|nr:Leucine carboxyl methyltransferase 1 [Lasiodiplodia theobromae]
MSAPQIPNLLDSLRLGRGGSRGRGRGLRHGPTARGAESQDTIVQQTDGDALGSRVSAVEAGYLSDPFVKDFVTEEVQRRFPIINRGTYVRTVAIDRLVEQFLAVEPDQPKQIVSLGAGSDTRLFRILSTRASVPLMYHEIDFPVNTRHKIAAIKRTPTLLSVITSHLPKPSGLSISEDLTSLHSPIYNIHPLDLRSLASSTSLPELPNLSPTTPTLILSECCLIYLAPDEADNIVANLVSKLIPAPTPVSLVLYEPIKPDDSFGQVMISNLARRGIVLQTLKKYSSLLRQCDRLMRYGFVSGQASAEVKFIWENWLNKTVPSLNDERKGTDDLDEEEEWNLLAAHYCVAWGWRDGEDAVFGTAWKQLKAQEMKPE